MKDEIVFTTDDELLSAYIDGELPEDAADALTTRLASDPQLMQHFEAMRGADAAVRDVYFYYRGARLYAARKGPWKAHFLTEWAYTSENEYTEHDPPLLYNLDHDPSEKYDVAGQHPEVLAEIQAAVAEHRTSMVARPDQLAARIEE